MAVLSVDNVPLEMRTAAIAGIALISSLFLANRLRLSYNKSDEFKFPEVPGFPLVGSYRFFTERYDFIEECTKKYGPFFKFYIAGFQVFHISGPDARQFFFSKAGDRNTVSMQEGYKMFLAATPDPNVGIFSEEEKIKNSQFLKRLSTLTSNERLNKYLPIWIQDLKSEIKSWGSDIEIDPFDNIYDMIFLLTIRTLFAEEIATNRQRRRQLGDLYIKLDSSAGFVSNLVSWLPSSKRKLRAESVRDIYMIVAGLVAQRIQDKKDGKKVPDDSLQYMIDAGDSIPDIMQFITGSVFAGVINTGMQSVWNTMFMSIHHDWAAKVKAELQVAIQKRSSNFDPNKPLDLSVLPVEAWDNEMPVLSACVSETNRVILANGTALRRVMSSGVEYNGVPIPAGSFLSYSISDCHFSKDLFGDDPYAYNPNHFIGKNDNPILDSRKPFDYVGWGAGRHPCAGMRMAKLELKVVVALMLTTFSQIEIVGSPNKVPEIDRNDNARAGAPLKPVRLRMKY